MGLCLPTDQCQENTSPPDLQLGHHPCSVSKPPASPCPLVHSPGQIPGSPCPRPLRVLGLELMSWHDSVSGLRPAWPSLSPCPGPALTLAGGQLVSTLPPSHPAAVPYPGSHLPLVTTPWTAPLLTSTFLPCSSAACPNPAPPGWGWGNRTPSQSPDQVTSGAFVSQRRKERECPQGPCSPSSLPQPCL